jgi:hypothetical protein
LIGKNTKIVSYRRYSWKQLMAGGFASPPSWVPFKQTPIFKTLTDKEFPGTILMGMRLGLADDKPPAVPTVARPFLNITGFDDPLDEEDGGDDIERSRSGGLTSSSAVVETIGKLIVTVVKADNVPSVDRDGTSDPYVTVSCNGKEQKTSVKKSTLTPIWGEAFTFEGVSVHDSIDVALFDWNRISGDVLLGKKDNIFVSGLMREAKTRPGEDFSVVSKYFVENADKGFNAMLTLKFAFTFDPRQRAKRKVQKEKTGVMKILKGGSTSSKSKFQGITIMGRPYPKNFQLIASIYCARDLVAADGNGLSDPYLELSYCGKKRTTETKYKTLNPDWMESVDMSVDVPMPAQFAPAIRCAVCDWDRFGSNDLLARFTIPFQTCMDMMQEEKARWFSLEDLEGNDLNGKGVYLGIEFMDPNDFGKRDKIFTIDHSTKPCDFHLLTIGVRGLKSRMGIAKPRVVYAVPIAGEMREVKTDPSSQPEPKNANFLVLKKITVDLPLNYELSPVLSLYTQDHKFGGLLKTDVGNASIALENYMMRIAPTSNDWVVKDEVKQILDEKELQAELDAEMLAESREFVAEQRVHDLALLAVKELTEVRTASRPYDKSIEQRAEEMEQKELEIFTVAEIESLKEELASLRRKLKAPKKYKPTAEEAAATAAEAGAADTEAGGDEKKSKDGIERVESESEEDPEIAALMESESELDSDMDQEEYLRRQQEEQETELLGEEKEHKDEKTAEADEEQRLLEEAEAKKAEKKLSKKEKKKKAKEEKAKDKEMLKAWDKANEEYCFDIDSKVPYNPDDFLPEYLVGRERLDIALETDPRYEMFPFENVEMYTGQVGGQKLFGNDRRQVGTLKGLWKLNDVGSAEKNPFGPGLKSLVVTRTVSCRLYVLGGYVAVATDLDGSSDPYLIVKLGREKRSTRKNYCKNTLKPKFHESFEFISRLPGPSKLEVQVWDYDGIGDDLIGITIIDIEDRWFSRDWRRLRMKPLERRQLANPRSRASYGNIKCWVDMMTKDDARSVPMVDISLPPVQKFELRLIVWDAKDVVIKDTLTDQNDLRLTCKLKLQDWQEQETDTHWRAKFGKGSWNWRCVFPVELPIDVKTQLSLSLWDQDIFSASDSIGEVNVSLDMLLATAYVNREEKPRLILRKDQTKRFMLDFLHSNFEGPQAKVKISMELMTCEEAAKFPAGVGRGDPNMNPYLPPPEGRFRWTWNPFELLRQLLGDKMCFKLYLICYCAACMAIVIFIGPQFVTTFFSNVGLRAIYGSN